MMIMLLLLRIIILAYLPEWDFNGIGTLSTGYGYQIKVSESIDDFRLCNWYFTDILGY